MPLLSLHQMLKLGFRTMISSSPNLQIPPDWGPQSWREAFPQSCIQGLDCGCGTPRMGKSSRIDGLALSRSRARSAPFMMIPRKCIRIQGRWVFWRINSLHSSSGRQVVLIFGPKICGRRGRDTRKSGSRTVGATDAGEPLGRCK